MIAPEWVPPSEPKRLDPAHPSVQASLRLMMGWGDDEGSALPTPAPPPAAVSPPPAPPAPLVSSGVAAMLADAERVLDADAEAARIVAKNPPVSLLGLRSPEYGNDPSELIQHRFLYRGGILLLSSQTGQGKSSFSMGWAVSLACGRDYFGMRIGHCFRDSGLRVLYHRPSGWVGTGWAHMGPGSGASDH
jgi:hypothetical protein